MDFANLAIELSDYFPDIAIPPLYWNITIDYFASSLQSLVMQQVPFRLVIPVLLS